MTFAAPALAADLPAWVQNGEAGFVVAHIRYALSKDADETGACPNGLSLGPGQIYELTPEGKRKDGESDADYTHRLRAGVQKVLTAPNGEDLCMHPELGKADPYLPTVQVPNIPAEGMDLDGQVSTANSTAAAGTCAHEDFVGMDGTPGIDNQFFRTVGCTHAFQSTGQMNGFETGMLTGAWTIVMTLSGVDDIKNDDEVEVGFYASTDPIQLSPAREPLPDATYALDQDPRFRATTHGRIVNGVLTTDPVDVRFHYAVNSMRLERALRHARVRMTLSEDGTLEGLLSGYTPVENMYDYNFGFRDGKDGTGQLASIRLRQGSSDGASRVLGHTCYGLYHALYEYADGDPDPKTGKCTSISTQYIVKAIPAFVVDEATESLNKDLDKAGYSYSGGYRTKGNEAKTQ